MRDGGGSGKRKGAARFICFSPHRAVWLGLAGEKFFFVQPGGKDRGRSLLTSIRFDVAG